MSHLTMPARIGSDQNSSGVKNKVDVALSFGYFAKVSVSQLVAPYEYLNFFALFVYECAADLLSYMTVFRRLIDFVCYCAT